jgi:mycofactocin precursor
MTLRIEESLSTPDHDQPRPSLAGGSTAAPAAPAAPAASLVEEDLLVEDVSIDGMCGVY